MNTAADDFDRLEAWSHGRAIADAKARLSKLGKPELITQRAAERYAYAQAAARDEGYPVHAAEYQRYAASDARGARNCVAELIGVPCDYDREQSQ